MCKRLLRIPPLPAGYLRCFAPMRRVVLLTAAVAGHRPRKQMVETAHPRLREAWAANGMLKAADFEAAFDEDAPYAVRRSLLGDVDDMPASDCGDDRKRIGGE